jgi:hypothetical protein
VQRLEVELLCGLLDGPRVGEGDLLDNLVEVVTGSDVAADRAPGNRTTLRASYSVARASRSSR